MSRVAWVICYELSPKTGAVVGKRRFSAYTNSFEFRPSLAKCEAEIAERGNVAHVIFPMWYSQSPAKRTPAEREYEASQEQHFRHESGSCVLGGEGGGLWIYRVQE